MTRTLLTTCACLLLGLLRPLDVCAQSGPDPMETARLRLGPIAMTPRIALHNIGVDTNVFNSADDPERDFTAALAPGLDAWLRVGRLRLTSETTAEWTYFHKATAQRSVNLGEKARLDVDLFRLQPFITGTYVRTRQRPNMEIDERVQQLLRGAGAGLLVRVGARLQLEAAVGEERVDFGQTKFGNTSLANALNRTKQEGAITARYEVTPLTTFVVRAATRYDRFETARIRDSDSVSLLPGFEFSPSALFSGTAGVGVRRFETRAADAPDYTGLIAAVDLKYVLRDMTRFLVAVDRDVDYSFEAVEPIFVLTSRRLEITQLLGYSWDVVGRAALDSLDYKALLAVDPVTPGRKDRVFRYGLGFGRRLGDDLRIGVDLDFARRTSDREARTYEGMRVGGSVTYGY